MPVLDFDMFNGVLNGSVEAYKSVTTDLLVNFLFREQGMQVNSETWVKFKIKGLKVF
jgi:hypothetical protein